jgi:hypothetical protein
LAIIYLSFDIQDFRLYGLATLSFVFALSQHHLPVEQLKGKVFVLSVDLVDFLLE